MQYFRVISDLHKQIRAVRIRLLAIFAAIIIGMLFALLTVHAFWDPTTHMQNLDVPVVVLDRGAVMDEEEVNFGEKIAENIEDNDSVHWIITEDNVLEEGIENTDYYFGFIIPAGFSQRIADAPDDGGLQAKITFVGDARKNFLMSQMSTAVRTAFSQAIAESIGEAYANALYDGLETAANGMQDAADGSQKLSDGLQDARKGTKKLKTGAGKLQTGSNQLAEGAGKLQIGSQTLAAGAEKLHRGSESLAVGAGKLHDGSQSLAEGLTQLSAGSASLAQNMDAYQAGLEAGLTQLSESGQTYTEGVSSYIEGYRAVYEGMLQAGLIDQLPAQLQQPLTALYENGQTLQEGGSQLQAGIEGAASQLQGPLAALTEGAVSLATGAANLEEGAGSLVTGAANLEEGAGSIVTGTTRLEKGARSLAEGAGNLQTGAQKLSKGVGTLQDGIGSLLAGEKKLQKGSDKLTEALEEGSETIQDGIGSNPEGMASFVAAPLDTVKEIYGETDKYGLGLAPMFLSLGLWLGTLILFFAVPLRPSASIGAGRISGTLGGYTTFLLYVLLIAVAVVTGALCLLGIEAQSVPAFFLWAAFCGATFLAVLQMLHAVFGELPAKAVAILFIAFQIASSGGAMDPHLEPAWLQRVSPFFPMRYSIDGFREVLFGGDWANLAGDVQPLLVWIGAGLLLTTLFWKLPGRRDTA